MQGERAGPLHPDGTPVARRRRGRSSTTASEKTPLDAAALPRLAFVHIPKTGGTSITHALKRAYGDLTLPAMTTLDYPCYTDAQLADYRLYKGHAYRRDYERLPAGTRRLTVLRDPVERALSYFQYCRALDDSHIEDEFVREASRLAKTCGAIEFIYSDSPFIIEHVRLGQIRQFLPPDLLATVGHRQTFTRVLRNQVRHAFAAECDRFDAVLTRELLFVSFPLLVRQIGLPSCCAVLPHDNASGGQGDVDTVDLRRALMDVNAAEFACYDHVRRLEAAWLARSMQATGPNLPHALSTAQAECNVLQIH